jgi:hypothetical protein
MIPCIHPLSMSLWQWQPTLVAHDPNPPITLENAAVASNPFFFHRYVLGH